MKSTTSEVITELTLAEAAAWLTRLQEPGRTVATEAAFKEWLARDPAHANAFTRVSEIWELLPSANALPSKRRSARTLRTTSPGGWWHPVWTAAAICVGIFLAAAGYFYSLAPVSHAFETAVGEQRTVVLDDQTSVTLNTNTRFVVTYGRSERKVSLEHGEALFRVINDPNRPFVVKTGDEQVMDLGTIFDVRKEPQSVAVTLLEGKVWVRSNSMAASQAPFSAALGPGERVVMHADGSHVVDRPDLAASTAWQHGQIILDDTTLLDAVAEFNRYGGEQLRIADPALAGLHVSGVFSLHDPGQFATAVASLKGLKVMRDGKTLVITR